MFAKFKRFRSTACKIQFTIDLHDLIILQNRDDITLVCIEFERNTKSVCSSSKLWANGPSPSTFNMGEDLCMTITLYKDSNGKFIPKAGKIVLKGHSTVTQSAVILGLMDLKLHSLAADHSSQKLCLHLNDLKGKVVGSINTTITAKYLGDVTGDDDMSSIISGDSDLVSTSSSWGIQHGYRERSVENQIRSGASKEETDKLRRRLSMNAGSARSELDFSDAASITSGDSDMAQARSAAGKRRGTKSFIQNYSSNLVCVVCISVVCMPMLFESICVNLYLILPPDIL